MDSDESHFDVLLIARDKVARQCPQNHNTFEEKGEPKRYRTEVFLLTTYQPIALPLGQTGSHTQRLKAHTLTIHPSVVLVVELSRFTRPDITVLVDRA